MVGRLKSFWQEVEEFLKLLLSLEQWQISNLFLMLTLEGRLRQVTKVRGKKKAINQLLEKSLEEMDTGPIPAYLSLILEQMK